MDKKALIIVDVQNDFCEGGSLAVKGGAKVSDNIAQHLRDNGDDYDLIVTTQDWHVDPKGHWSVTPDFVDTWPVHCEAMTHGAEFFPSLANELLGREFTRTLKGRYEAAYSGFQGGIHGGTTLQKILQYAGITDVMVVGLATDHCVKATVLDALILGFNVSFDPDLAAGVDPERTAETLTLFTKAGVNFV